MEKREPSFTLCGNENWYNHYGKQYGGTSENEKLNYHMIQHSHFWVYIWAKLSFEKYMKPYVHCSTSHNSQDMEIVLMSNDR